MPTPCDGEWSAGKRTTKGSGRNGNPMIDDGSEIQQPTPRRRWLRWLAGICAGAIVLPLFLVFVMRFVDPPVSSYMVIRALQGQEINREWRDLGDISEHLIHGALAAEDARFCSHNGVDWVELQKVLDQVADNPGEDVRGASTVTMQTVKNLYLWPSPSYLRKAIEIPLAYWMDLVVPKRRIVELYLNIVEWAPGVYGAQSASRHHFGVDADGLSREQATLLVAVLPNPIARNASRPGRTTRSVAERVRRLMREIEPYLGCL